MWKVARKLLLAGRETLGSLGRARRRDNYRPPQNRFQQVALGSDGPGGLAERPVALRKDNQRLILVE
jgi:hypothetical protein